MGSRDVCGFELIFHLSDSIDSSTVGRGSGTVKLGHLCHVSTSLGPTGMTLSHCHPARRGEPDIPSRSPASPHLPVACVWGFRQPVLGPWRDLWQDGPVLSLGQPLGCQHWSPWETAEALACWQLVCTSWRSAPYSLGELSQPQRLRL